MTGRAQRFLMGGVSWYQRQREGHPSPCRFTPTCSNYSLEALETYGAAKGTWLTVRRLLRCRPFGPYGFDPVPERSDLHPRKSSARQRI
jgi:putative membrane protein insertion efficiency factor